MDKLLLDLLRRARRTVLVHCVLIPARAISRHLIRWLCIVLLVARQWRQDELPLRVLRASEALVLEALMLLLVLLIIQQFYRLLGYLLRIHEFLQFVGCVLEDSRLGARVEAFRMAFADCLCCAIVLKL